MNSRYGSEKGRRLVAQRATRGLRRRGFSAAVQHTRGEPADEGFVGLEEEGERGVLVAIRCGPGGGEDRGQRVERIRGGERRALGFDARGEAAQRLGLDRRRSASSALGEEVEGAPGQIADRARRGARRRRATGSASATAASSKSAHSGAANSAGLDAGNGSRGSSSGRGQSDGEAGRSARRRRQSSATRSGRPIAAAHCATIDATSPATAACSVPGCACRGTVSRPGFSVTLEPRGGMHPLRRYASDGRSRNGERQRAVGLP